MEEDFELGFDIEWDFDLKVVAVGLIWEFGELHFLRSLHWLFDLLFLIVLFFCIF